MSKSYKDNPMYKREIISQKKERGEKRKMSPYKRDKFNIHKISNYV